MDILIKVIAAAGGIFALYKILIEVILAKSNRRREEYDFSKKYLKDLYDDKVHVYVKEKGFLALTGQVRSIEEIKYLLELKKPHKAIEQLALCGSDYLYFNKEKSKFCWLDKFKLEEKRNQKKKQFLLMYIVFASLFFGQFLTDFLKFNSLTSQIIFSGAFLVVAITGLVKHEHIKESELFKNLAKNTI